MLGLSWDHIKELVFPLILWLNNFKWAPSPWAAAQVLAVSIVYRGSEWRGGSLRDGQRDRQTDRGGPRADARQVKERAANRLLREQSRVREREREREREGP